MVVSAELSPERIRATVKRIQAGAGLSGAPTLRQLLEHTVEMALNGLASEIKESTLAIEVFGRKTSSFDPRFDPIVRVQARKLRDRLSAWYETEGAQDEVVIEYVRGSYVPRFRLRESTQVHRRSVAVLPFTNLSDTAALDYVCDGIAEELRYLLSRVHGVRVVAHASSVSLRKRTEDVQAIGTMLNADLVVRGTVRSSGAALRITAEVIAADDGYLVWADRCERPDRELFRVHDEIAAAVADALQSQVSRPAAARTVTHDVEAHDLYLRGRFYWNQRTHHGFRRAIEHYEAALARDPAFARVHAALADTWTLIAAHHLEEPLTCLAKAHECATEAVRLDPELAAAHSALAATLLFYDRRPQEAEREWKHALRLDPNYAYAWHGFSVFGCFVWPGSDEAQSAIYKARRLEPLSAPIACDVGFTLYCNGQYEEAIEACQAAIDLHPLFSRTYVCLARTHAAAGRYTASVEACIQGRPLFTGRAFLGQLLATQAYSYGRLGRNEEALRILHELERDANEHFVALMDLAVIHTGLGNANAAIDLLEHANDAREFWSIAIPTEPLLHSLRTEARFRDLAARVFEPVAPSSL
jgi:serine/threonine-protein kinase